MALPLRRHVLAVIAGSSLLCVPIAAHEDERLAVEIPEDIKILFLEDMRERVEVLDDLILVLSEGDFQSAAQIARTRMGFGHHLAQKMEDEGKGEEEISAAMEKLAKKRSQMLKGGKTDLMAAKDAIPDVILGASFPPEFRSIGLAFHDAVDRFADAAGNVKDKPGVDDYTRVLEKLRDITVTCRACHGSFRIAANGSTKK